MGDYLELSDEIAKALAEGIPVVALETTVIAHGLPPPMNLETAHKMEAVVREEGAIPATIGILNGRAKVGVSDGELATFAQGDRVAKVSCADLAAILASGGVGATTVAATVFIAARAGIPVMATGGIGGVHRGAEDSFDISADLGELARSPVAVVCAGAKAILDLPRTLEVLETLGVPVVGCSTHEFPAFFSLDSGLRLNHRIDTPDEAARLMKAHWNLGLRSGIVFGNPPPKESALTSAEVETLMSKALVSAKEAQVPGKAVTPYLLTELARLSDGRTLRTNLAVLENNARVAAAVAVAYSQLEQGE